MTPESPSTSLQTFSREELFSYLSVAHRLGSESPDRSVPIWTVGEALGISDVEADVMANELVELDLVNYSSLAGDITLTSLGVSEVVLAQTRPEHPTTHFPALSTMTPQMLLPLQQEQGLVNLVDQLKTCHDELVLQNTLPGESGDDVAQQLMDQLGELDASLQLLIDEAAAKSEADTKAMLASWLPELESLNESLVI